VLGRDEGGLATRGLTTVVGDAVTLAPVHPKAADTAPEKGSEQVRPWCVVGGGPWPLSRRCPGRRSGGRPPRTSPGTPAPRGPALRTRSTALAGSFCPFLLSPNGPSDPGDPSTVRSAMHGFLRPPTDGVSGGASVGRPKSEPSTLRRTQALWATAD
jgi:hypothetical protein